MSTLKWVVQNYQSRLYERVYSTMKSMTIDNDEGKDDYGASWMNERRKKDDVIAMLKRKINALESTIKDMDSTSTVTGRDKGGWTGDELIFVKDINDFCRERLYPKEKFLRKNWQEYPWIRIGCWKKGERAPSLAPNVRPNLIGLNAACLLIDRCRLARSSEIVLEGVSL